MGHKISRTVGGHRRRATSHRWPIILVASFFVSGLLAAWRRANLDEPSSTSTSLGATATSLEPTSTASLAPTGTPQPTTTTTTIDTTRCQPYSPEPDRSVATVPGTTTPSAPRNQALQAMPLTPADVPCSQTSTLADVDVINGQFRPCGYQFDNTSGAVSHDDVVLQIAEGRR